MMRQASFDKWLLGKLSGLLKKYRSSLYQCSHQGFLLRFLGLTVSSTGGVFLLALAK